MKRFLFFTLCLFMAITASASATNNYNFEYEEQGITIVFNEDTVFTAEKRQQIADVIVYSAPGSDGSSTYAWCWLTGHDITSEAVIAIQHKVSAYAPRCRQTIYQVDTCSNCDYVETTELSSVYIDCCPED